MWMAAGRHRKQGKERVGIGMGHEKGAVRGEKEKGRLREGIMKWEKEL